MSFRGPLVLVMSLALTAAACGVQGLTEADAGAAGNGSLDSEPADNDAGPSDTMAPVDSIDTRVPNGTSSVDIMTGDSVMQDLAERRGVPVERVVLVSQQQVTWPSGALGCPQSDRSYTQALVPGGRIVLSVDDVNFFYHSGRTGVFFYCENPLPASSEHPDA